MTCETITEQSPGCSDNMNTNPSIQSDGHLGMDWSDMLDKLNGESQSSAPLLLVPAPPTDNGPASRESETKASKLRKRQQWQSDRSIAWTHWCTVVTPNAVDAYLQVEQQCHVHKPEFHAETPT